MKVHDAIAPRARKNLTAILSALADVGQSRVAELLGESEATISRFKADQLERCAAVLAAIGLKVVDEAQRHYSPEHIRALNTLARIATDTEGSSNWSSLD